MRKVFWWIAGLAIIKLLIISAWLVFWVRIFDLPNFDPYLNYKPYQTAYFLDRNGEILGCFAEDWREVISKEVAKELLITKIILAVEDRRFYERKWPIDARAILRAAWEDLKKMRIVEGGSTLEQQLVRQLLSPGERFEKSIGRKIKEVILGFRLISQFSKDERFTLYLNEIYLGHKRFGVEAAARFYFNKTAADLTLSEAATIAGIIKSPEKLSPKKHPEETKAKRNVALRKAFEEEMISETEFNEAIKAELVTTDDFSKSCQRAPHAIDYVRGILASEYKLFFDKTPDDKPGTNEAWYGLVVRTALDRELQQLGTEGLALALKAYHERQGQNAIDAEGAFLAIENGTGAILAMVGGNDYNRRQFNSAVQARRQTGSAFKPIVYVTKFEEDLALGKPYNILLNESASNAYIKCKDKRDPKTGQWTYWTPKNFDEKKFSAGSYTRRFAIAQSINRPAVWTAQVGGCRLDPRILIMAKRLGIEGKLDNHLPTALGASGISLLELVRAYSVFPSKGVLRETYIISEINGVGGKTIFSKQDWKYQRAIGEVLAGVMVEALRGVVKFGTARSLDSLSQPSACKTGTTERYIDTWLICFTPHITLGAWMGGPEDYTKSLGDRETGARMSPVVRHVLENWYKGYEPVLFPEESEEYMQSLVKPSSFQKEMESIKNSDPDVEAPQ